MNAINYYLFRTLCYGGKKNEIVIKYNIITYYDDNILSNRK